MAINATELVEAFSDSLGEGKAKEVIEHAATEAGLQRKHSFSKEEALAIADAIANREEASSFVRVSANTVKTRIRSGDMGS